MLQTVVYKDIQVVGAQKGVTIVPGVMVSILLLCI